MFRRAMAAMLASAALLAPLGAARAEDGYQLWLRYPRLAEAPRAALAARAGAIVALHRSPTIDVAVAEVQRGLAGLTGSAPAVLSQPQGNAIVLATVPEAARLGIGGLDAAPLGEEGFRIVSRSVAGKPALVIVANKDAGLLYGAFRLLELAEMGTPLDTIDVTSAPKLQLRMLNHWDNLDRSVERGYAGQSIWDWWKLPGYADPRYTDYARANASIGINGTVLNNVNAVKESLTPRYIAKAAKLADIFRPYHIRVYLSARFSAPIELGHLKTADPLDPAVQAWWKDKADELYRAIPDFGGFLVKANSEGQPGPQDYHRTHAEGANLLARAVAPHGGIVIYRAFVYSQDNPKDRARQAYDDFKPLDGQFDPNVIVQVKNGAIDFQPREPFHPLFGGMPKTPLMAEFQITKEYLGFATHLVYLGPLFEEVLRSDTLANGRGSTVARVLEGKVAPERLTGMAGVANIGDDRDWSGSTFNQANWYAYGRFAWDPEVSAEAVAREWTAMTFTPDPRFVGPVVAMMMGSREAAVDYMTPLGLAHQMATGHHYGPGPWVGNLARPDWNPTYYAHADASGIGFDRTKSGSDAVDQYAPALARLLADPKTTPERDLLWFHHVGWDYRMQSGRTLWDEMVTHYDRGVADVAAMQRTWATLRPYVDPERYAQAEAFLIAQHDEAVWWRDASIAWFSTKSQRPLPAGAAPPAHSLDYYEALQFPFAPGHPGG
ncbi:alpha-glucuronidase family glycosyl hydrolase [Sphingomonas nostoxanthinifaciens]|uniref:alpha-glucuronidase family glycosyl hydrolase n=1 Tax=Sphingomonas nostoxanthinifaciens TaxID=2872652 RepID=UPI001CC219C9|nr:alpha-glucuronidase family glycosyl hydrolase [Sphingomonas nostoxanthinifaciens]UAK26138.1 alpha-glucuronidase [Sphingomonas nostoxanthinifaciens]